MEEKGLQNQLLADQLSQKMVRLKRNGINVRLTDRELKSETGVETEGRSLPCCTKETSTCSSERKILQELYDSQVLEEKC